MKQAKSRKVVVLNGLGTVGYVACAIQWLWTVMILLPLIIHSSVFTFFTPTTPTQPTTPVETTSSGAVPVIITIIALCIGVVIILGALYIIFFKLPKSIARTGQTVTHVPATTLTPLIIEHTHLPQKQRRALPVLLIAFLKLLLVFTPLCLLFFAQQLSLALSFELIMFVGIIIFAWSFLSFALQFALSQLLKVDYTTIR